jgi:hypothetical protein
MIEFLSAITRMLLEMAYRGQGDLDLLRRAPGDPRNVGFWHLATTADQTLCPLLVKTDAASPTHPVFLVFVSHFRGALHSPCPVVSFFHLRMK